MTYSPPPNQADFIDFLRNIAGISPTVLPDNSPTIPFALQLSLAIVNPQIEQVDCGLYVTAVYQLGTSNIINYAQDQAGQTFFKDLRSSQGINSFSPGVVSATSDEGTSSSLLNPDFMKQFTLANLQQVKDPFGRAYLAIAQSMGTLWGTS